MNIYKIANDTFSKIAKIYFDSVKNLPLKNGKFNDPQGRMINLTVEFYNETDLGDMYIHIYYNINKNKISIERYFENETVQDDYGKTIYVDVMDNVKETQNVILESIKSLSF